MPGSHNGLFHTSTGGTLQRVPLFFLQVRGGSWEWHDRVGLICRSERWGGGEGAAERDRGAGALGKGRFFFGGGTWQEV